MAAGSMVLFAKNKNIMKLADLNGVATINMALFTSAYTPNVTITGHEKLADLTNQVANGQGYTTGGVQAASAGAVAARSIGGSPQTDGYKLTTGNFVWTASGTGIPAWRYAVLYYVGTLWGVVNPIIGYMLGDSTPADVPLTTAGNTLTISPSSDGWFDLV